MEREAKRAAWRARRARRPGAVAGEQQDRVAAALRERGELTLPALAEAMGMGGFMARGKVTLAKAATESDARTAALAVPGVALFTDGKQIKKFVYVPGKIVNLVVA